MGFSGLYQSIYSLFFHTISRQESRIDKSRPLVKEAVSGIERPLAVAMIVLPRFRWRSGQQQAEKTLLKIDVRAHTTYGAVSIRTVLKGRFFVKFEDANELADQIGRGGNRGLHEELVQMCIPYLFGLRKRFGFRDISVETVRNELAKDAVSDGVALIKHRKLPFTLCLRNAFRDCCRERRKLARKPTVEELTKKCGISHVSPTSETHSEHLSPDAEAVKEERLALIGRELENHEPVSKRVVYEWMRGSPYKEIAPEFGKTDQQCRAVFQHDMNKIRENLRRHTADDKR